ncbi:hypothetical protein [Cohnella sp. REN36]|uniref:hypothetical protein n=1 Tax=Cohnella sp. REN36 TaxID=2887347 RepID=UPI001D145980|nr:hypothetical protein [Cohnella sp. REN36]MCC3375208.1 hypothetical protein [Cohnella sp. REN36]
MRGLYRLLNLEFGQWLGFLALLFAGAVLAPLYLLDAAAKDYNLLANHVRFEDLYAASGCPLLFFLLLLLLCAYFLKTVYAGYWGSKSVYTYLTIPVRRESLYWSKLMVFLLSLLLLLVAQLLSIRIGYAIVIDRVSAYQEGNMVMHNGLFLAFVRSDFFRLLLPFHFSRILSSISLLLVIATGFYYAALCERSRKYAGFALIGITAIVAYKVLVYRLNEASHAWPLKNLYPSSLILLALSGYFVWHSLRWIRRGTIA